MQEYLITIVTLLLTGGSTAFLAQIIKKIIYRKKPINSDDLIERIQKTTKMLNNTINDISFLQQELIHRIKTVETLKKEALEAESIIQLSNNQVQAVKSLLNIEVTKNGRKTFLQNLLTNFIFFILGAGVSFLISKKL